MDEFVECEMCASKPGSPVLCSPCLQNRTTINNLHQELARLTELCQSWEQIAKTGMPVVVQKWLDEKLGAGKSVA